MSEIQPSTPLYSPAYIMSLESKIIQLENKVQQLENRIAQQDRNIKGVVGRLPNTSIISPNFLTRAFAVWGHMFVAQLIIVIPIYCIIIGLSILASSGR